jgi:hypothetical protein
MAKLSTTPLRNITVTLRKVYEQLRPESLSDRDTLTNLRNRYHSLHIVNAMLPCSKSLFKAELSDFHGLWVEEDHQDVHSIFMLDIRIAEPWKTSA